jgi:carbamoyl-phosphate synthase large subunit
VINILVTGAGGGVGQGVIKSLKMIKDLDIRIVAADMSELAAGLYAADVAHLVGRCGSDNYLRTLSEIFTEESIEFYIPGTDVELKFCALNKQLIKDKFNVHAVISSSEVIEIADNKFKTSCFLKKNNFNYPRTDYLKDVEIKHIEYPVIIKPSVGCRSIGVYKVDNYDELMPHLKDIQDIVIQECVGDDDKEYTCTVVKVNNELSPVLALKRVLRSGDTYRAEPIKSTKIEQYILDVASKLDIDGGCNFQLRLDLRGEPKIFEINSRFSGTTPFCAQIGFNPVEFYLKRYLGIEAKININYNSIVLRYWSEVVVEKNQLTQLSENAKINPHIASQFELFP